MRKKGSSGMCLCRRPPKNKSIAGMTSERRSHRMVEYSPVKDFDPGSSTMIHIE